MASQLKIATSRREMENITFEKDLEVTAVIMVEEEIRSVVYVPEVILY